VVVAPAGEWVLIPSLGRGLHGKVTSMTAPILPSAARVLQRPVRVFDSQPDLLDGLAPSVADLAWHVGVAESTVLPEGSWTPPDPQALGPGALGLLVLDGLLTRSVGFDDRHTPELVGAGDLLRPWESDASAGLIEVQASWLVMERATIALLDARFAERACRVPGLFGALLGRSVQRSRWLAFHAAVTQVRRAEPRLLLLLWHMAERWGRVTPHGVHLPLRLTHTFLARLACMRRPTVSAALARLARAGDVERNADRTWMLTGAPPDVDRLREPVGSQRRALAKAA
jgi:hypothetical protein